MFRANFSRNERLLNGEVNDEFETEPELEPESSAEDLVTVGRYRSLRQANDDTLLILSMGLAYWMVPVEQGYEVRVEANVGNEVLLQLERSRKENRFWPRSYGNLVAGKEGVHGVAPWGFAVYLLVLGLTFLAQIQWGVGLTHEGSLQVQSVLLGHEWWRPITALTLHADVAHLLGNLGMGSFFAIFVVQAFGNRLGWSLILWAGVIGNTLNVGIHAAESYSAIGASTAVFSAVGLIAGNAFVLSIRNRSSVHLLDLFIPVFVALVMLAWWGSSGANTDIMGHLMGLMSGLMIGSAVHWFVAKIKPWMKGTLAIASVGAVVTAWTLALLV